MRNLPLVLSDVVLMEIRMPALSGIECVRKLKCLLPNLPVVMYTTCTDEESILLSLISGARGYLIKPLSNDELFGAIERVARGGSALCDTAQTAILTHLHSAYEVGLSKERVTERERQIMVYLANNLADKEISTRLNIAPNTVHVHLVRLFQKLGVHSRGEAIQKFFDICSNKPCCHYMLGSQNKKP